MHDYLESAYNDGRDYVLHYVSAREMYNIAKAAEAGKTGDPGRYRDYELPKPGKPATTNTNTSTVGAASAAIPTVS
jgi:hypothetical protein